VAGCFEFSVLHERRGISLLAECLLASDKGLCFMDLVIVLSSLLLW
jgi:hypothetical protein